MKQGGERHLEGQYEQEANKDGSGKTKVKTNGGIPEDSFVGGSSCRYEGLREQDDG